MIILNGVKVNFEKFPNGETRLNQAHITPSIRIEQGNLIEFVYEDDSDLIKLLFLRKRLWNLKCILKILYMPYSRMDRVDGDSTFTLKYICEFINSMNFSQVYVVEPHSDVTPALLNNCTALHPTFDLLLDVKRIVRFDSSKDYLFFPDAGAQKRYGKWNLANKQLVGMKDRDFQTGKIKGLQVVGNVEKTGFKVIIVDDLCSYGGTFYKKTEDGESGAAYELKKMGASEIYLLVTHCEKSIFNGQVLTGGLIDKVFTTNIMFDEDYVYLSGVSHRGKIHLFDYVKYQEAK